MVKKADRAGSGKSSGDGVHGAGPARPCLRLPGPPPPRRNPGERRRVGRRATGRGRAPPGRSQSSPSPSGAARRIRQGALAAGKPCRPAGWLLADGERCAAACVGHGVSTWCAPLRGSRRRGAGSSGEYREASSSAVRGGARERAATPQLPCRPRGPPLPRREPREQGPRPARAPGLRTGLAGRAASARGRPPLARRRSGSCWWRCAQAPAAAGEGGAPAARRRRRSRGGEERERAERERDGVGRGRGWEWIRLGGSRSLILISSYTQDLKVN
ncbi:hypothetical protein C2845_PM03G23920 [Panicum miliaceum]|uniref:Uncharacterized protein n=1 Tax=Panicum miliaceum TaxID=4540 RepID=A0A3L6T632_PANMI|nr:hypothetical protein C2845_PM03G23920 [Panicum miliaceum]